MGSDADKLAAPRLFGKRKPARTPEPATPVSQPEAPESEPTRELPSTVPVSEPTAALPVVEEAPQEAPQEAPPPVSAAAVKPAKEPKPVTAPRPPKPARERTRPTISGGQAAALAGLVVGAFLVLATFGSLHACSAVRGTSTCGGRAGFPLLLAIGVVAVLGGAAMLRAFRVASPTSDSFLAVALVTVLTVLFLGNHYDAWWMFLAVPVLSIAAYALSHWVSVRLIDGVES